MAQEIAMPQMGVTMESGTVLSWLKQVGDRVAKDEPIMEIQTDKVNLEVTSDVEGTLLGIVVREGQEVPVGTVLAYVGEPGEAMPHDAVAPTASEQQAAAPAQQAAAPPAEPPTVAQQAANRRPRATPAARSRARAYGIQLETVRGSGPAGRIKIRDVEAAALAQVPATAAAIEPMADGEYRDVPVAGMRKVIAQRMVESFHQAVPVLLTAEAAMDRADELLGRLGDEWQRKAGVKPGYLPLVIKAAAVALRAHRGLNAHWLGNVIRLFQRVHVGVAVALDEGLTVPVLQNADQMGLAEIASRVAAVAKRAREGSLALPDLEGGTFSVSSLGGYGIGFFAPVINPPQVGVLGIGKALPRPVARNGRVEVAPLLPLSLVFDHRAIDGAPAAAFLDTIKESLEDPYRLLL